MLRRRLYAFVVLPAALVLSMVAGYHLVGWSMQHDPYAVPRGKPAPGPDLQWDLLTPTPEASAGAVVESELVPRASGVQPTDAATPAEAPQANTVQQQIVTEEYCPVTLNDGLTLICVRFDFTTSRIGSLETYGSGARNVRLKLTSGRETLWESSARGGDRATIDLSAQRLAITRDSVLDVPTLPFVVRVQ